MKDVERVWAFESQLISVTNLVDALQLVNWEFTQAEIKDKRLERIRSAVVGIGDSLEKLLAENT